MSSQFMPRLTSENFGASLRDDIIQTQIDTEVGQSLTAHIDSQDPTVVVIQLVAKNGQGIGQSIRIKVDPTTIQNTFTILDTSGTLTASMTPTEVAALLPTTVVFGKLIDIKQKAIALGPCINGIAITAGACDTAPIYAAGSGKFEIIGDLTTDTWRFNS